MEENENPYAAPAASPSLPAQGAPPTLPLERPLPATHGLRLANFLIDWAIRLAVAFVVGVMIGILAPEKAMNITKLDEFVISYVILVVYYIFMEGVTGTTVGKLITRTRVIDERGMRPPFGTMVLRSLCRIIPFEPFSFLGSDARGWHDSITKTWVVRKK